MNMNQTKLNTEYREILNVVFGEEITLSDKYLNPKAVIKHHCKTCMRNFYARPLWLVNKRQLHECYSASTDTVKVKPKSKPKKATPKKAACKKKVDFTPNKVTEAMKIEMIQLYKEGNSLKSISRKFSVTPPTVKRHIR